MKPVAKEYIKSQHNSNLLQLNLTAVNFQDFIIGYTCGKSQEMSAAHNSYSMFTLILPYKSLATELQDHQV